MKYRWRILLAFASISAVGASMVCGAEKLERYEFFQIEMGVPFRITLYAASEAAANKAARAAYRRVEQLNAVLSDYDPDSELMQLCRKSGPGQPVRVGDDLMRVLTEAQRLSRRTDGAFDVTVGPVVRLWRIARRKKQMPAADDLKDTLSRVGYHHVRLDRKKQTVELLREGMRIDLGGIAKGYAADEVLKVLKSHDIRRALIDASGDVVAGAPPPGRRGWIVAVAGDSSTPPDDAASGSKRNKPVRLRLANAAAATSGDAYQFVEIDGVRYSHIIDPTTGLGLTRSSRVTVIAPTGMEADSLASAVSVLGAERGLKLVGKCPHRAAMMVTAGEGKWERTGTESFARFVLSE